MAPFTIYRNWLNLTDCSDWYWWVAISNNHTSDTAKWSSGNSLEELTQPDWMVWLMLMGSHQHQSYWASRHRKSLAAWSHQHQSDQWNSQVIKRSNFGYVYWLSLIDADGLQFSSCTFLLVLINMFCGCNQIKCLLCSIIFRTIPYNFSYGNSGKCMTQLSNPRISVLFIHITSEGCPDHWVQSLWMFGCFLTIAWKKHEKV